MTTEYESLIPTFPLFKGYTRDGARMLMERGTVKNYGAGDLVFREGDPPTFVLLVLTGRLQVYVDRDGKEVTLSDAMGPGSLMGELAVLCGMKRSACARVAEPAAVLQWTANDFRRLLLGNAFLAEEIFGHALRHMVEKERAMIDAALQSNRALGSNPTPTNG